jgi:predicted site-specific integrase-resolvase
MTEFVSSKKAQEIYKVKEQTLRDWANSNKINFITTAGGHRRYCIIKPQENKQSIIYARVSSKKQENDLERQVKYLQKRYPNHEVIKDIGSGINYKRKGFRRILEQLFKGNIEEVVVSSSDRFSRFGRDLFEWIFEQFGTKFTILSRGKYKSNQDELAEDLMEIITVFSARYYGRRKYKNSED